VSVFVVHAATAIKSKSAPMRAVAGARVELVGRRTAREACDMGKIERWAETLIGDVLPCDALLGTKRAARRTSLIADTAHFLQLRPRMPLRSRFRPTLFVACVAGAASAVADRVHAQTPRPTGAPAGGTEAAAVATVCALFAAAERNDLVALDTLYAGDSLTVIEGAGINRTWADYRDHHLAPELKAMRNLRYRPSDIEVHATGNMAWAIFRYTLRADVDGRAADVVGRGTAIIERRGTGPNARWVVRHTQTSGRARRPSDPPAGD